MVEAGYISETPLLAALQAGRNVVFSAPFQDTAWHTDTLLPHYRHEFPSLQVALWHVSANFDVLLQRAQG